MGICQSEFYCGAYVSRQGVQQWERENENLAEKTGGKDEMRNETMLTSFASRVGRNLAKGNACWLAELRTVKRHFGVADVLVCIEALGRLPAKLDWGLRIRLHHQSDCSAGELELVSIGRLTVDDGSGDFLRSRFLEKVEFVTEFQPVEIS